MFGIDDAIASVGNLASTVVNKIWPDATEIEKAKFERALVEIQNEYNLVLGQLKINEIEAGSANLFVSGWRPALGWVCVASFSYEYVLRVIFNAILTYFGSYPIFLPIDVDALTTLLFGMLGLTAARTVEKVQNVARK